MESFPLLIGPYHILGFIGTYLVLLISTLYLIGKYEKRWIYFIWLITLIVIPILGSIAYLLKHFTTKPRLRTVS